jgi:hypothetical protein
MHKTNVEWEHRQNERKELQGNFLFIQDLVPEHRCGVVSESRGEHECTALSGKHIVVWEVTNSAYHIIWVLCDTYIASQLVNNGCGDPCDFYIQGERWRDLQAPHKGVKHSSWTLLRIQVHTQFSGQEKETDVASTHRR